MKKAMKRAGSAVPSANRITLLRDADGDGRADLRSTFLSNLNSPFGIDLVGGTLYVANTDALMRFPYRDGDTAITAAGTKVADLPGGAAQPPLDQECHREPRRLEALRDRRLEQQRRRERHGPGSRPRGDPRDRCGDRRAPGLRLGPAQSQRARVGAGDRHAVDGRQRARRARQRPGAGLPDVGAATAASTAGRTATSGRSSTRACSRRVRTSSRRRSSPTTRSVRTRRRSASRFRRMRDLPERFPTGMFIGQHGSWNRKPLSGYKVIFVPFSGGKPSGPARRADGFRRREGNAKEARRRRRRRRALLVADDVGNVIWRTRTPGNRETHVNVAVL